jgi:DNA-directed RNA polymerase specialized sigma24 family protein
MARLTIEQLKALRAEGNWKELWTQAIPWVRFTASMLRTDEMEDLIQDGLIAVGKEIKNWDPDRGHLSTFVKTVSRNAMLWHITRKDRRRDASLELHDDGDVLEDGVLRRAGPTYSDTVHTPEGFGDPATEIGRLFSRSAAETLLQQLDAYDSLVLREHFGLPVLEQEGNQDATSSALAKAQGLPVRTYGWRKDRAQRNLAEVQERFYINNTMSIYPPEDRQPHRTHIPADERHPGFWNGMAEAMGDVDAWRESTGTVWNDWSWKPTEADIENGAKR